MSTPNHIAVLSVLLWILLSPPVASSEQGSGQGTGDPVGGSIVVKSDALEVDNRRQIITFSGQVEAQKEDLTINCEKMLVYYKNPPGKKGSEQTAMSIDRIVATGKVKVSRPDGAVAMAEKAIYYERDQKVVLTGGPVVKQGNDFVQGSKITLYLREKRSVVEGSESEKVRAVLHPRREKR